MSFPNTFYPCRRYDRLRIAVNLFVLCAWQSASGPHRSDWVLTSRRRSRAPQPWQAAAEAEVAERYYCYQVVVGEQCAGSGHFYIRCTLRDISRTGVRWRLILQNCVFAPNESTVLAERGTEFCSWERERSRFSLVRNLLGYLSVFHSRFKDVPISCTRVISVALCLDEMYNV